MKTTLRDIEQATEKLTDKTDNIKKAFRSFMNDWKAIKFPEDFLIAIDVQFGSGSGALALKTNCNDICYYESGKELSDDRHFEKAVRIGFLIEVAEAIPAALDSVMHIINEKLAQPLPELLQERQPTTYEVHSSYGVMTLDELGNVIDCADPMPLIIMSREKGFSKTEGTIFAFDLEEHMEYWGLDEKPKSYDILDLDACWTDENGKIQCDEAEADWRADTKAAREES